VLGRVEAINGGAQRDGLAGADSDGDRLQHVRAVLPTESCSHRTSRYARRSRLRSPLFDELGSARQVVLSLRADGLRPPRRSSGSRVIRWAEAPYPAVHDFITNPTHGGAFVYGRRKVMRRIDENGRIVARERELPREEWEVKIPDHHAGFISWEVYLSNQDRMRANARPRRGEGGGAVRERTALLQGLVVCGRCGRRMLVGYPGADGHVTRYLCAQGLQLYGPARICQSLSGRRLDDIVVEEVFAMLQPAALTATAQASRSSRPVRYFSHAAAGCGSLLPGRHVGDSSGVLGHHGGQRRTAGGGQLRQVRPAAQHRLGGRY
jgi:hypothetical protein